MVIKCSRKCLFLALDRDNPKGELEKFQQHPLIYTTHVEALVMLDSNPSCYQEQVTVAHINTRMTADYAAAGMATARVTSGS